MKHFGDITKIKGDSVPAVDIVIGGSPCQDLSVAGKRAGLSGERSGLFMEQIRVIKEMREHDQKTSNRSDVNIRPRYMVWENVPGVFTSNKGEDFRAVLEETARIKDQNAIIPEPPKGKWAPAGCIVGDGWSIAWRIHDAQFWGVPQRRRRLALVADFGGESASEILFERESVSGNTKKSGKEGQEVAGNVGGGTEESSRVKILNSFDSQGNQIADSDGVYPTLRGSGGAGYQQGYCLTKSNILNNQRASMGMGGGYVPMVTVKSPKCLNPWDVQSKHIQPEDGKAESLYAGECRYGGGESYVLQNNHKTYRKTAHPRNSEEGQGREEAEKSDTLNVYDSTEKRTSMLVCDIAVPLDAHYYKGCGERQGEERTVVVQQVQACDMYNHSITGDVASTLNASSCGSAGHSGPSILVLNDQGGSQMNTSEDISGTLRAEEHGHQPCVINISAFDAYNLKEDGDICKTLTSGRNDTHNMPTVFGISPYDSNAMKSGNPHSGIYRAETSRTLDLNGGSPTCNQGGMAIVQEDVYGFDWQESRYAGEAFEERAKTITTTKAGAVCKKYIVRRLTPLECERLQGFPDGWTDIGEWVDSKGKKHKDADSPRYKALGNSIALPFWEWMAKRMVKQLDTDHSTMASLFDGIGGFPLAFERAGCKAVWASEIEEFPIAVTKIRFPEEEDAE